ncbi:YciI family protein [Kutzneria sp. CA-103260]|uniref:YciI family protein n=1 Tax=Kutzneria sp. CA-103260 TaxID=2802641 RepID=UPI001BA8BBFF|nr:YciI family protein [Kutzneria sp. CA-103260]QUQ67985.1 YCII-related domain protein [Kutzneria sp. CA-103260]
MKYLVLIYSNPISWAHPTFEQTDYYRSASPAERTEMDTQFADLMQEISASGELVSGTPLAPPATTRTVRVQDGATVTTDGPFAESKEQMAGYFVLDCVDMDRAAELAARFPDARVGRVEVRPIME